MPKVSELSNKAAKNNDAMPPAEEIRIFAKMNSPIFTKILECLKPIGSSVLAA